MTSNLILIDSRVKRYEQIVRSVNSNTQVIVFDFHNDKLETLINQMDKFEYDSVGLVQHNYNLMTYKMLACMNLSFLAGYDDNNLGSWDQLLGFLIQLRDIKQIKNFDFMACALESDPNWKKVLKYLGNSTGINIRASLDNTGSSSLGGNWFLETGSANLIDIYFTSEINNYHVSLGDPSSLNAGFITTTGDLYAYGSNNGTQLSSMNNPTIIPTLYPSMNNVKSVSFGNSYSGPFVVILKNDGIVYACGNNTEGELGNGTFTSTNTPVQVLGVDGIGFLSNIKEVSAGAGFSLFLDNSGNVYGCGNNVQGQLGIGTNNPPIFSTNTPVKVLGVDGIGFLSNIIQIAAGDYSSLFLDNLGNVYSCGYNGTGELGNGTYTSSNLPVKVLGGASGTEFLSNIIQIASGSYHSLFLDNSGNVYSCGYNEDGELGQGTYIAQFNTPVQVLGVGGSDFLSNISQIAAGSYQSLFLNHSGNVYSCGNNILGQLGNNTTENSNTPVQVLGVGGSGVLSNIKQVSGGIYLSIFLDNSGNIYSCGTNNEGQLGINSAGYSCIPLQFLGVGGTGILTNINLATGGYGFSLFLDNSGNVYGCGNNENGQLGDDTTIERTTLVQVLGGASGTEFLSNIKQTSGGYDFSLFLDNSGNVYACGNNDDGQLGDGTNTESETPVQVLGGASGTEFISNIKQVATGGYYSLFLDNSGNVYACGNNENGALGNNTTENSNTPVQVLGVGGEGFLSNIKQIAAGSYFSLFLDNSGNVYGCGYNYDGELGDGTNIDTTTPVQVLGVNGIDFLSNIKQIVAADYSSIFLDNSGNVYACGYNFDGELGNGTSTDSNIPVQVLGGASGTEFLSNINQIAACYSSSLFLDNSGNVYSCGYNEEGELGDNTITKRYTPVQVVGLGGSGFISNINKINAGGFNPLLLNNAGNVYSCGDNSYGQLGNNFISQSNTPIQNLSPVSNIATLSGVSIITPSLGPFTPPTPKTYGDAPFTLTPPTSTSPGSWSYLSSNTSIVTISGSTATIVGTGNYTITANQAASGNYTSASTTSSTLTVNKATPSLGPFTVPTPKTYGNAPFNLTDPSSNSTGSWSYASSNTSVATIIGNTVTIVGAGSTNITGTQAATSNYNSASTPATLLTVLKATPSLGPFTVPTPKTYGNAPFNLTDPSSNSTGSWSYTSSNTSVATIIGNTVTIVGVGSTNITGTQAATSNYNSASTPATPLTVNKATPSLGPFTPPTPKNISDPPFTLTPPSSNSTGSWSYISSNTNIVSISGSIATIVAIGNYTITANQTATTNYTSASITSSTLSIVNPPTIGPFNPPTPQTYGDPPFTLTDPSSNSDGSWSFVSSIPYIVSISGSNATIVGYGNYTITAIQDPSGIYTQGSTTSSTLTVYPTEVVVTNANELDTALSSNNILIKVANDIILNPDQQLINKEGPVFKILLAINGNTLLIR